MALTKCKECGHEVSTKAEACPSCGAKIAKKGMGCGTLLLVLFVVGVVAAVISPSDRTPSSSSEPRTKSPREEALETVSIKNFSWRKGGFEVTIQR